MGSIEGRVAVQHVEDAQQSKNFTFKCHRVENDVYAVNDIRFHPTFHTFVTAGDDGAYNFWDKEKCVGCVYSLSPYVCISETCAMRWR